MLTSLLLISLASSSVDFSTSSTIEKRSVFFMSQANENGARVKALKPIAKSALEQACRRALTFPEQELLKFNLGKKLDIELPSAVSFIDASIEDYHQQKNDDWLECTGKVQIKSMEVNEAFLALKLAWFLVDNGNKQRLRDILKITLSQDQTKADSIVLIASQSPAEKGLIYLDKHLNVNDLKLTKSKVVVADMWFESGRFEDASSLLKNCKKAQCDSSKRKIEDKLDSLKREQAEDLSSYF